MKKILIYSFILLSLLFLSGCDMLEGIDTSLNSSTQQANLTPQEAIDIYGEGYAFVWENGEPLYFPYDDSNVVVCIDSNLSKDYIDATILAVKEFDALEYISLSYELSDDINTEEIEGCSYSEENEEYNNNIVFTYYEEESDTLGYNSYTIEGQMIIDSVIYFNLTNLDDEDFPLLEHVALHELGHTFGLDDLYEEQLGKYSIMYNNSEYTSPDLLPYDLHNLEWMYSINDTDPDE